MKRLRLYLKGAVQGVGFRPFVYRLALKLGLKGFVLNEGGRVLVEVEGKEEDLRAFLKALKEEKPSAARIDALEVEELPPFGYGSFKILTSREGSPSVALPPDAAVCPDCLRELYDPKNRRYRYPFITCTVCGPRYTLALALPFDRENTTMKHFRMCPDCKREYEDPADRRFHAQTISCPRCGPKLYLYGPEGLKAEGEEALRLAVKALKENRVVAVKGVGGFHLVCNALSDEAVGLLRKRKRRPHKPFAVMFKDEKQLLNYCRASKPELTLLKSPAAPIVLLKSKGKLSKLVAPGLDTVGAFLPYTPLHHLLLSELPFPVVATSANLSGEPIVKDDEEALKKLFAFADLILLHDRPIARRCDDSVVKLVGGKPLVLRRSRGFVPEPLELPFSFKGELLAVGGQQKNAVAFVKDGKVFLSHHVGDLETEAAVRHLEETVYDLKKLFGFRPSAVVCDLHPRYESTRFARRLADKLGLKVIRLQHHFAHAVSCMADNRLSGELLALTWDGTGLGTDGTIWGGEFLKVSYEGFERVGSFRSFRLLGGESAVKEPRKTALALLFELLKREALELEHPLVRSFSEAELKLLYKAYEKGVNAPVCSSAGRLFDAVAAILGVCYEASYEAQAPSMLEALFDPDEKGAYPFSFTGGVLDWGEAVLALLSERDPSRGFTRFLRGLAKGAAEAVKSLGFKRVCLTGGVMQNAPLVSLLREELERAGAEVFVHERVPANDGGLSYGQAVAGAVILSKEVGA
ncbi:MAG: carbamoyltransferase HypF [Aquificae bacterium]|nr:carbamoyltransferase HypF [Aquificota bacterium]